MDSAFARDSNSRFSHCSKSCASSPRTILVYGFFSYPVQATLTGFHTGTLERETSMQYSRTSPEAAAKLLRYNWRTKWLSRFRNIPQLAHRASA